MSNIKSESEIKKNTVWFGLSPLPPFCLCTNRFGLGCHRCRHFVSAQTGLVWCATAAAILSLHKPVLFGVMPLPPFWLCTSRHHNSKIKQLTKTVTKSYCDKGTVSCASDYVTRRKNKTLCLLLLIIIFQCSKENNSHQNMT